MESHSVFGLNRVQRIGALTSLIVIAAVADLVTTWYGLEMVSGLYESNPNAKSVFDSYGWVGFLIMKTIAVIGIVAGLYYLEVQTDREDNDTLRTACVASEWVLGLVVVFVWGFAAVSNLSLILSV